MYNVSVVDLNPPSGMEKIDYLTNVTANITDAGNHSSSHEFFIHYVAKATDNSSDLSTGPPTASTVSRRQKTREAWNVSFLVVESFVGASDACSCERKYSRGHADRSWRSQTVLSESVSERFADVYDEG